MPQPTPHETIRDYALGFPDSHEEFPWGESVVKVRKKVFVFLGQKDGARNLSMSVKLPNSLDEALAQPFAEPTGYGLGKSGWVTVTFPKGLRVPLDQLREWVEESYRAIAPKTLVKQLDSADD